MNSTPADHTAHVPSKCGTAHSTIAFAALGDHQRLPWRFFARLFASDGSLLAR